MNEKEQEIADFRKTKKRFFTPLTIISIIVVIVWGLWHFTKPTSNENNTTPTSHPHIAQTKRAVSYNDFITNGVYFDFDNINKTLGVSFAYFNMTKFAKSNDTWSVDFLKNEHLIYTYSNEYCRYQLTFNAPVVTFPNELMRVEVAKSNGFVFTSTSHAHTATSNDVGLIDLNYENYYTSSNTIDVSLKHDDIIYSTISFKAPSQVYNDGAQNVALWKNTLYASNIYSFTCDIKTRFLGSTVKFDVLHLANYHSNAYQVGHADGLDTGRDEGYIEGRFDGFNDGYTEGLIDGGLNGYTVGFNDGYTEGKIDGELNGYTNGELNGYTNGYTNGHADGETIGYINGQAVGYTNGYNKGYGNGRIFESKNNLTLNFNNIIGSVYDVFMGFVFTIGNLNFFGILIFDFIGFFAFIIIVLMALKFVK